MDKLRAALGTSEFWMGLAAAVATFLASQGLIPAGMETKVATIAGTVYAVGRVVSKLAKWARDTFWRKA